jgi:hypothetical protein
MKLGYFVILGLIFSLTTSCSPVGTDAHLLPVIRDDKLEQDNAQFTFDPRVDILFVVDNSASMAVHQDNLAKNVSKFTSTFTNSSILDYNIGVVTTDTSGDPYTGDEDKCCGKLVGEIAKVVSKTTPGANEILADNIMVGINGDSYEKVFDPIVMALSPALLTGWNAGFYRQDASLAVIFITDAEDQSRYNDPQRAYQFLTGLKNGNKNKVLGYGVIVPSNDTSRCERDETKVTPRRIEEFLKLVTNSPGNIMSLCDPDYGTRLANLAKDIVEKVGSTIYLDRPPVLKTVHVTYGSLDLPRDADTGWSYDLEKNAIVLGRHIDWNSQPIGSRVKVSYTAAEIQK